MPIDSQGDSAIHLQPLSRSGATQKQQQQQTLQLQLHNDDLAEGPHQAAHSLNTATAYLCR